MTTEEDIRFQRSEKKMQDALLHLLKRKALADIGVSELSREAGVSRATFYSHYENVNDIYEQLVCQMLSEVQTFSEHFECSVPESECASKPYCELIRSSDKYADVARESRFFSVVMATNDDSAVSSIRRRLLEFGIPENAAHALMLFQMSGCHAVAASEIAQAPDWARTRTMIDRFILGGIEAVKNPNVKSSSIGGQRS